VDEDDEDESVYFYTYVKRNGTRRGCLGACARRLETERLARPFISLIDFASLWL